MKTVEKHSLQKREGKIYEVLLKKRVLSFKSSQKANGKQYNNVENENTFAYGTTCRTTIHY
jgi:hypothetical protein